MKLLFSILLLGTFVIKSVSHAKDCTYQLNKDSIQIGWVAYKTSEKIEVNGKFKNIHLSGALRSHDLSELLTGLTISVDPKEVDSENPVRDKTLVDFFFNKFKNPKILGRILKISEIDRTFMLSLSLNGKIHELIMKYSIQEKEKFLAEGAIDLLKFGTSNALDSLNQKCHELHKGKDGVSKIWPHVQLKLNGTIHQKCK